jgi:exodeoxyribonuclease VII large subunit
MEGRRYVGALMQRFGSWAARYFQSRREAYARLAASASMRRPVRMLQEARQELDEARERTMRALSQRYRTGRERFARAAAQLGALSPLAVLSRGYSVVQKESGETVKEASQLSNGQRVTIRFCRGRAGAEIREVEQ